MPHEQIEIATADGRCATHVFTPDGDGPWPAAILYIDGLGMRASLEEMAARLASNGYFVLLPDLFYRVGMTGEIGTRLFASGGEGIAEWKAKYLPAVSADNIMRDTEAFLATIDGDRRAAQGPIGITGYCMGGRLSLYAAGHFGARVGASAAYHPGGLATDAPDSPHRLAPQMTARVYVGAAKEDRGFDAAQQQRLDEALTAANVVHTIEQYDAFHGWVPRDTPVHDVKAAERHWETLLALFGSALA